MLVELPVVEQRYLAVREVLDTGAGVIDVARRYAVDRRISAALNEDVMAGRPSHSGHYRCS
jgi:hypothetical protein